MLCDVDMTFMMMSCSFICASGLLFESIEVSMSLVLILIFDHPFTESNTAWVISLNQV